MIIAIHSLHHRLLLILLILCFLSGCQSLQSFTSPDPSLTLAAEQAVVKGDHLSAARQYEALAANSYGDQQSEFYLKAATAYWHAKQTDKVPMILAALPDKLSFSHQFSADILRANIALSADDASRSLQLITHYTANELTPQQQRTLYQTRLQAYQATDNWLEQAHQHLALAPLLNDDAKEKNQQALWRTLSKLPANVLDLFNPGEPPNRESGWFALAYIVQAYQRKPDVFAVAIEDWKRSYPNHPAPDSLYNEAITHQHFVPKDLKRIAILLPEAGPYAAVAKAIRDGISAAHYTANNPQLQLEFITLSAEPYQQTTSILTAYQQAIDSKAQLVIGPLDKAEIKQLSQQRLLPVPILALNQLLQTPNIHQLFQFGLNPQHDVHTIARQAWQQGHRRAAMIIPNTPWAERLAQHFEDIWLSQGGVITDKGSYTETDNDFSVTIKPLLGLSSSQYRHQQIERTIGRTTQFEPRRRDDIDFIFMLARPDKARQLIPQLKYHRSGQLPILSTSHAYNGQDDRQNIDLHQLFIANIPWAFPAIASQDPAYINLQQHPDSRLIQYLRFYALGVDAYRLSQQLHHFNTPNAEPLYFDGATGLLTVHNDGVIERDLSWGQFRQSKIKLLHSPNELLYFE